MSEDLCVCTTIERKDEQINVRIDDHSLKKDVTVIEGIKSSEEMRELETSLKNKLGCDGTVKDGRIELQGNQINQIKDILIKEGYEEDNIEIEM